MTTDPAEKPYAHNAEQAEAHKLARAEGDGPVSNETARAYLKACPADKTAEAIHALAIVRGLRERIRECDELRENWRVATTCHDRASARVRYLENMLIRADAALETLGVGKLAPVRVNIANALSSPNVNDEGGPETPLSKQSKR